MQINSDQHNSESTENSKSRTFMSRRRLTSGLAIILLTAVLCFAMLHYFKNKSTPDLKSHEVQAVIKTGDCSKILPAIKDAKPDPKALQASIDLLKYQSDCLTADKQYSAAIKADQMLEQYYMLAHQDQRVDIAKRHIDLVMHLQSGSTDKYFKNDPISPELEKEIHMQVPPND